MVISGRSLLKSMPGMTDPFSLKRKRPFRSLSIYGERERSFQKVRFESIGALPSSRCPADSRRLLERFQGITKALVFDRKHFTKLRSCQHTVFSKEIQHSFLNVTSFLATDVSSHRKMCGLRVGRDKFEVHGSSRCRRAVLAR